MKENHGHPLRYQALSLKIHLRLPPPIGPWRKNGSASLCPLVSRAVLPQLFDIRTRVCQTLVSVATNENCICGRRLYDAGSRDVPTPPRPPVLCSDLPSPLLP